MFDKTQLQRQYMYVQKNTNSHKHARLQKRIIHYVKLTSSQNPGSEYKSTVNKYAYGITQMVEFLLYVRAFICKQYAKPGCKVNLTVGYTNYSYEVQVTSIDLHTTHDNNILQFVVHSFTVD